MIKCEEVAEFLPWFVNGTLSEEEAESVSKHLADCDACRRELGETGAAFEIFGEHLAAETLVDLAFEEAAPSDAAARHLRDCAVCAERLALARESRGALEEASSDEQEPAPGIESPPAPDSLNVEPFPVAAAVATSTNWRALAMAASIAAMVTSVGWIYTWQGGPAGPAQFRGADADARDRGPLLNVAVVEVAPMLTPDGADAALLPADVGGVTLILDSWLDGNLPLACRLQTEDGTLVWQRDGLAARAEGGYALSFPTADLEAGLYRLTLVDGDGVELERYAIEIR